MTSASEVSLAGLAARYDLEVEGLTLLSDAAEGDGPVYAGERPDGRAVILKVTRPMAPEAVARLRQQTAFVQYLFDGGAPVAEPLPSDRGALVESVDAEQGLVSAVLYARAPGRPPRVGDPRTADRALLRRWGAAMGRMHALTRGYDGGTSALPTWVEEHAGFGRWSGDDPPVQAAWMALRPAVAALPQSADRYGLVHNDLHAHNLLVEDERLTVIDFDVCAQHWFTAEIATALFSVLWAAAAGEDAHVAEAARAFLGPFLEGYASEATLPPQWEEDLPLFLRYRERLLYIVFSHAWGGEPGPWQREWLARTRRRVLDDAPALSDPRLSN